MNAHVLGALANVDGLSHLLMQRAHTIATAMGLEMRTKISGTFHVGCNAVNYNVEMSAATYSIHTSACCFPAMFCTTLLQLLARST
jgi:hypothetical protein